MPVLQLPDSLPVRVKGRLGPICTSYNDVAGPVVSPQYVATTFGYPVDDYRSADVS